MNQYLKAVSPLSGNTAQRITAIFAIFFLLMFGSISRAFSEEITVFKSPTCGCCSKWVDHMRDSGFDVKTHDVDDLSSIKARLGIPGNLQSCHTAVVGDYVVEGHVPADLVKKMLKDKPEIKGLTVPGMPMGSPGMEGPRKDAYQILTFDEKGKITEFARR